MEMRSLKLVIIVIATILMWSCSKSAQIRHEERAADIEEAMEMEMEMATEKESVAENQNYSPETYISSSAALENPSDTSRRMIRTANIKFKVKDVIKTTYNIENIVIKHDGFVENTNLSSQINYTKKIPIKEDSTLLTTYYTVSNTLILRVPNISLDATLKEIAQFVEFMDYRIIDAKDVTLDLLAKRLEQSRLAMYNSRMTNAIDNTGRRLNDVSNAEDNLLRKQAQADEAKLANLQTLDKIKFSTITLSLYQNQNIKYEVIAKEKTIKHYATPFGTRFIDALQFGWTIIVEFVLFLVNIWPIILIGVIVLWTVRYFKKRISKRKST